MEPRAATPKTKPALTIDNRHRLGKQEGPPREAEAGRFSPRRKRRHSEQAISNYLRTLKT
jgi:hypothetical protein